MIAPATRREVLRTMLAASIGGMLPASNVLATAHARPDFEPVRNRIRQAIAQGHATGVAVAVAQRGSIVWEEGFGWANREAGLKVTPHTPFSLASITKTFTATTLMTLVADGKLTLDEPGNKYLAKSRIEGTNGEADQATVRLLGAHASGLPTMFESYDKNEKQLALTPDALLSAYGRLAYPPGSCYEYSNIGFAALDAIASNVTGSDIGTLMTERVLQPLGLRDSFFDTDIARLPGGAVRYDPLGHLIPYYTTSTPASGELYASAHDLARFAMFNMRDRVDGQKRILDDRWLDELHRPAFAGPSGIATTFGWFTGHLKSGLPIIFKTGGQPGVATILFMIPSERLACLVLTNQSDARALAHGVCDQILSGYLAEWREPQEDSGPGSSPLITTGSFGGRWEGLLLDGGARMRARLNLESPNSGTFAVGENPAKGITKMRSEGVAFTGETTGLIDSPDAIRTGAKTLKLKLLPHKGKLVGRVLATSGDPDIRNVMLPYVLTLERVSR